MAISSYLRECGYELGGLLPKIYLVHKNALKLSKKAKGLEVSVVSRNDGDIYCVEGQLCTYKQDETYNGKYRFNSTLELTINELYREPFLYGLRTLRTNEYYIIIEDKKGVQYLINPELYTKMSYEYSFSDTSGNNNHIIITYNNLSNYPLLIFEENISDNKSLLNKQCEYNYGQAYELLMFDHKDLKVKDDGVKVDEMYIENVDDICEIDFMKESFSLTESYDGKTFITSLAFNIPLNDQYGWAYRLLEFKDNKYAAILRTTNDNYIIVGVERGLFPSYTIETSEDDNVPNMVKVVFEQRSQYPILYTDEITQYRWVESEPLCFGFDRYQMLVKEKSEDWGETWVVVDPIVKKKGKIIESDSEACKEYQWVEDGEYCDIDNITYIKWENVDGFICEGGNKYHKTRRYVSEDGKSFSPSDEYGRGELIEEDSKECQYVAVRWIDDDDYECYEVNEEYTRWIDNEEICSGVTLYQGQYEKISSNGIAYYESGEKRLGDIIRDNCCACGYREEDWRDEGLICGKDIIPFSMSVEDLDTSSFKLEDNTITSTKYFSDEKRQRIYLTTEGNVKCTIRMSNWISDTNISDNWYENDVIICYPDTEYDFFDYKDGNVLFNWNNSEQTSLARSITIPLTKGTHFIDVVWYKQTYADSLPPGISVSFETLSMVGNIIKYERLYDSYYWTIDQNTVSIKDLNYIRLSTYTLRVHFIGLQEFIINYTQDMSYDHYGLRIGNIDTPLTTTSEEYDRPNDIDGSITIPVGDKGYHYIDISYGDFPDGIYITLIKPISCSLTFPYPYYEQNVFTPTTKYLKRKKHLVCNDGVDIIDEPREEYHLMPYEEKCYECGYITYMWKLEDTVCYNALPEGIEISEEEIETNVDKGEYING